MVWQVAIAAVGTALNLGLGSSASRNAKRANKARREAFLIENYLERLDTVRQGRLASAAAEAAGRASGAGAASSGILGVQGSVRAQIEAQLAANQAIVKNQARASRFEQKANRQQALTGVVNAATGIGISAARTFGGGTPAPSTTTQPYTPSIGSTAPVGGFIQPTQSINTSPFSGRN